MEEGSCDDAIRDKIFRNLASMVMLIHLALGLKFLVPALKGAL